ncbi:MAG TPA: chromate efflux transporter [Burkholderiales bacterium]|nr:chromate efflux transporter [Burkholderiales bacterium]
MTDGHDPESNRWHELARAFLKLGAMSYGGAAIMGIMQAEIQEKRGWLTKERYLEGLALVQMLPGAPATQLAIYIGHNRAGWRGGVLSGACFILPGFFILLALTLLYSAYGASPVMRDALYGLGPVVLGIFAVAVRRLGKAALKDARQIAIAIAAALMIAFTPIGIAGTLLLAGCTGVALYHSRTAGLRAALIVTLLIGAWQWRGAALVSGTTATHVGGGTAAPGLRDIASFFFQAGAFTFGGGITVLAFVQDQVVNQLHWLTPQEFLDGLALGQLTPGPILTLASYVGYKLCGLTGAFVGVLTIFLPSFILILSVLPILNRFREITWIRAAMRAISAAVIGVISVSLVHLAPYAIPDAFTALLFALTIAGMLTWKLAPLSMMVGGGLVGIVSRLKPIQRLKDLA